MATRIIKKDDTQQQADIDQHNRRYAVEYLNVKEAAEGMENQRKNLREVILGRIRQFGKSDQDGNVWLPAIDHMLKGERRLTTKFDPAKAEKWLRDNGWWDDAKVEVPEQVIPAHETITEDAVAAFLYQKRDDETVPADLPEDVYNEKETFALKVTKETQYDY
jgi:hypothetical protein